MSRDLIQNANPLSRIGGLLLLGTPLLVSVDLVSASVALAFTLALSPLAGVGIARLLKRSLPIIIAAPIAGISMALYGRPEGHEYFSFLFAHVTDNSFQLAAAIMVRVLAVGMPVVVLLANIDPTELGDALAQNLKLPPRFVIGAVAATRLVSLFSKDWQSLKRARRSRGLDGQGKIRTAFTLSFGLLVLALRRGAKLATAMEARGFGSDHSRSYARESRLGAVDWCLMAVCLFVSVVSVWLAVATGQFRFLGA